jgi:hypothetical protein
MKTELRPAKRGAPHPLVTLGGALIAFALFVIALKTTWLSRPAIIILATGFLLVFRVVSRRSAKAERQRREQDLEQLRSTPVLHLND